ncbi:hypothetical protein H2201_007131 [Coniosporium apollinis]|uniref:Non-structural maintenance of chromosomes element 1 homolog n=1 Tax=Coniosporium apollinis TaxID=61459 RepID=A0ABQ9NK27_9PEZI|nr:hypothetical protein H2201_007131 [Coniosporium apollinis]
MADAGGDHYNNSHRAFLQAFLARSVLTFEEAQPILAAILTAHEGRPTLPADITTADFQSYLSALNTALSPLDLEIRSTLSQHSDRTRVYALVNVTSDPQTQLATTHSADEIAFVKRVLDAMFETNNTSRAEVMAVAGMQALRLCKPAGARQSGANGQTPGGPSGGVTMGQAEAVLAGMVEEGWFEKSRAGYYSLSPRALMELRGWLVETYNELGEEGESEEEDAGERERIKFCQACREIVTVRFFRDQPARKCPLCKADWTGKDFVGERAAKSNNQGRRSDASGPSRRTMVDVEESDEEG